VMGYFDGNTVTALWNYTQKFAMNDNSFGTTFGPSTPVSIIRVTSSAASESLTSYAGHGRIERLRRISEWNGVTVRR
jgi:phospholipase C